MGGRDEAQHADDEWRAQCPRRCPSLLRHAVGVATSGVTNRRVDEPQRVSLEDEANADFVSASGTSRRPWVKCRWCHRIEIAYWKDLQPELGGGAPVELIFEAFIVVSGSYSSN